ncbi:sulfurtransferase-like selenium metabolism protein YedF [Guggenheimella bovis]
MKQVLVLDSNQMGHGSEELGVKLIGVFLKKLWANPEKPESILFYNSGVKLLTKEGGALEALEEIERSGVDLIACGTCVEFYGIEDQVAVGRISGMVEIVDVMMKAEKVITL